MAKSTKTNFDQDAFDAWLERHPGGVYSEFSAQKVARNLANGRTHPTLGPQLQTEVEWRESGKPTRDELLSLRPVGEDAKVCEYGCGSLRVGVHFIERQQPGCFMGLDVTEDFIAYGRDLMGQDLIAQKQPRFGAIKAMLPVADEFGADLVYCTHVAIHVHPDEKQAFASNLKRIAQKPGSTVIFDALITPEPVRFRNSGWGWPISYYQDIMSPMRLAHIVYRYEREGVGQEFFLVFNRHTASRV